MNAFKIKPSSPREHAPDTVMLSPWARSFGEVFTSAGLRVLQEPIAHFLAAGLALAIAGHLYQSSHDVHRIVVTQAHIAELANQYALQFGVKPETATLDGLVDRDVHDEILFRQGRLAKLDVGDEIVRRRVVQKMQFLAQDLNPPAEPTPEGLRAYYQSTIDQYRTPSRTTFSHIFFSSDRGGDDAARNRALAVLATLSSQTSRAPERGDPFPDLYDFAAYEPGQSKGSLDITPSRQPSAKYNRVAGLGRSGQVTVGTSSMSMRVNHQRRRGFPRSRKRFGPTICRTLKRRQIRRRSIR